ncbi:MAG: methylmalonyl-CoA mutase [Candidatus Rokubacteria bacterium]|nr:methylmalonyl-CoA mutase [Candidatus Rokubacteria bacterium]
MFSEDFLKKLRAAVEEWEARHRQEFATEERQEFANDSGIPLRRVYTPLDLAEKRFDYLPDLGLPGEFPYTRGINATMYRSQPWKIRQYAGISTAAETNRLFKSMIRQGQTALSLAFDLPTQLGYDSDHPKARGEVGKVGLTINSLRDWAAVFDGIDVASIFVNSVSNAQSVVTLAMHVCVAKKQGLDPRALKGSLQNDVLKEYICRGNFIFPVEHGMRLAVDSFMYCMEQLPEYWPVNLGQVHLSEAGASLVHEAAFALGNALAYMDGVVRRGGDIDRFASRFSFAVSQDHTDFFGEIAKLRAQRRLLARLVRERYGAKNPESMMMRVFSTNGGSTMCRPHPVDNQTRNAIACIIAALSGVQMIGLRTMDEVLGIPSEEAVLASIRTQEIVGYEANLRSVVDPLGGSYYLEWLTSEMEDRIRRELDRIEAMGGMVKAIEKGYVQRTIMEDAYQQQRQFETGDLVRVGVNRFVAEKKEHHLMKPYQFNPEDEARQLGALAELRRTRDAGRVRGSLEKVTKAAATDDNVTPAIIEAVEAYATMGEICGALKDVFGEYREPALF